MERCLIIHGHLFSRGYNEFAWLSLLIMSSRHVRPSRVINHFLKIFIGRFILLCIQLPWLRNKSHWVFKNNLYSFKWLRKALANTYSPTVYPTRNEQVDISTSWLALTSTWCRFDFQHCPDGSPLSRNTNNVAISSLLCLFRLVVCTFVRKRITKLYKLFV